MVLNAKKTSDEFPISGFLCGCLLEKLGKDVTYDEQVEVEKPNLPLVLYKPSKIYRFLPDPSSG